MRECERIERYAPGAHRVDLHLTVEAQKILKKRRLWATIDRWGSTPESASEIFSQTREGGAPARHRRTLQRARNFSSANRFTKPQPSESATRGFGVQNRKTVISLTRPTATSREIGNNWEEKTSTRRSWSAASEMRGNSAS